MCHYDHDGYHDYRWVITDGDTVSEQQVYNVQLTNSGLKGVGRG